MRGILLLISFFLFCSLTISGQNTEYIGRPLLKKFNSDDYLYHGQTWATVEAPNGYMYFAHNEGILEYNGKEWRMIPLSGKTVARSLAAAPDGKIFVGGDGEVGYLEPDQKGIYRYNSLSDAKDWEFKAVWNTVYHHGKVYFRSNDGIIRYDTSSKELSISPLKGYSRLIHLEGELYVTMLGKGIYKINDAFFKRKPKPFDASEEHFFYAVLEFPGETSLVFDWKKGFLLYDKDSGHLQKWDNELEDKLDNIYIYKAMRLRNGNFAFAVFGKGLFILDRNGKIRYFLDKNNALYENTILNVYEDKFSNLWFNTNNGIGIAISNSPFTALDRKYGLEGYPVNSFTAGSTLYTGTSSGIYYIRLDETNDYPLKPFRTMYSDIMFVNQHKVGRYLFFSSNDATVMHPGDDTLVNDRLRIMHTPSYDSTIVYARGGQGLYVLTEKNGRWNARTIAGFSEKIKDIHSITPHQIWITQPEGKVKQLFLNYENDSVIKVIANDPVNKHHQNHSIDLYRWRKTFIASTNRGFFKYDTNNAAFVPADTLNRYIGKRKVDIFKQAPDGKYWFWANGINSFGGNLGFINNGVTFDTTTFSSLQKYMMNDIDFHKGRVIFTTKTRLITYTPLHGKKIKTYQSYITQIDDARNDTTLMGNPSLTNQKELTLHYGQNTLNIHVSSNNYSSPSNHQFSYILEPINKKWSGWKPHHIKEYTSLSPGAYTFRVKSKDINGHVSTERSLKLRILAPWYMTTWAYAGFVLLFLLLVGLVLLYFRRKNRREKAKLERIIKERTQKLMEQKDELAKEKDKINKLNSTKDKFFSIIAHDLRSPFNSLLGFTEVLDEDFDDLPDDEKKELVANIHKSAKHSFDLIDNLLTWSRIQRNKITPKKEYHDLKVMADETINLLYPVILKKNISIQNRIEDAAVAYCDENMVITILRNLISNAVKFTENNGVVALYAEKFNESLEVAVSDNGVGMTPQDKDKLFDIDKQTKHKGTHNEKGTGLGLLLCRDFVEQHNGTIRVESEVNKGSTFYFTLPREPSEGDS